MDTSTKESINQMVTCVQAISSRGHDIWQVGRTDGWRSKAIEKESKLTGKLPDFQCDPWYGPGLRKRLVIQVPSHTDWSSLRVLVGTPCCIWENIPGCWIHPYRTHTSHHHSHLSSPLPLELTNFGGYRAAQADCLCLKENRGIEVAKWKKRMEREEREEKDKRCSKEPAAVMARCDLRDKPIRVRWEKHSRGKTRKKSKHAVKENELNGSVKFIKEAKEKKQEDSDTPKNGTL